VSKTEEAGPVTIVIGLISDIPEAVRPEALSSAESFSISVSNPNWNNRNSHAIVLAGADMRGTIYAVYEFSQKYLGVDPLYYWTDHEPARRTSTSIPS